MNKEEIKKIIETQEYEYYGLRLVPFDQQVKVGEKVADSFVWIDNSCTGEKLNGASAIEVDSDTVDYAINLLDDGGYTDGTIVLIGSDEAETGNDEGEIVLEDAMCVMVCGVVTRDEEIFSKTNSPFLTMNIDKLKKAAKDKGNWSARMALKIREGR